MTNAPLTQDQQEMLNFSINSAKENIERAEYSLKMVQNVVVSHGWVVCYPNDTTTYAFTIEKGEDGLTRATNAKVERPYKVNRFTQEDATTVALATVNSAGQTMQARPYIEVIAEYLQQQVDLLEFLEARTAA